MKKINLMLVGVLVASVCVANASRATQLSDFIGNYHYSTGDAECYPNLLIDKGIGSEHPENGLVAIAGQSAFPFLTFFELNSDGYYYFNSPTSEWVWTDNTFANATVNKKEARAKFFKPLKIFAKTVATLTLIDSNTLSFAYPVLIAKTQKNKAVSCSYIRN